MIRLIKALDREHQGLTTDYLAPDLFNKDDPAVNWLRSQINQTVIGYLRQIGIDYEVTDNGSKALNIMRNAAEAGTPIDLLVSDIEMPGLDGYELAFEVRNNGSLKKCDRM